jgi:hypothetical protein
MPKVGPFTVTTKGTKAKFSEGDGDGDDPTQEDLQKLAEKHRDTLKELDMDMEGSADFDLTIDAEVSVGCLPKLKVLKLVGTDISKMRITKEVFPALESLELQGFAVAHIWHLLQMAVACFRSQMPALADAQYAAQYAQSAVVHVPLQVVVVTSADLKLRLKSSTSTCPTSKSCTCSTWKSNPAKTT